MQGSTYPFGFEVTLRFIAQYLDRGARLLDAACGRTLSECPSGGRVSRLGASDLADANVRVARPQGKALRVIRALIRQGNALDASTYAGSRRRILLLGPCYHLPERQARVAVYSRHLRTWRPAACSTSVLSPPCGLLVGTGAAPRGNFENRSCPRHCWHAAPSSTSLCQEMASPIAISAIPASYQRSFPMQDWRYNTYCATEGPFGGRVGRFHALERPVREAWLQFILHNCEEPILVWASEHILVVAKE